ncbi:hypothetical protein ACXR2W_00990 [Leucobacter sp. HY1908]
MSDHITTTPEVTVETGKATIEWTGKETGAWESILIELVDGHMQVSGRGDGPVSIPVENIGVVMAYMAELNVEAQASRTAEAV